MVRLSKQFQTAVQFAIELHSDQYRKGTATPYLAHLLAVTATVLENGGDEEMAIAALLHDAVEDQGGYEILEEIRNRYGERIAKMVDELSDSYTDPKPPWRKRKVDYLAHLPEASSDTLLISLSDKLHNARSILQDFDSIGEEIWDRFNGGKEGVVWYYRSLADFFKTHRPSWLADEFDRVVTNMEARANGILE